MSEHEKPAEEPVAGRRPYQAPVIEDSAVFESLRLACLHAPYEGGACYNDPSTS